MIAYRIRGQIVSREEYLQNARGIQAETRRPDPPEERIVCTVNGRGMTQAEADKYFARNIRETEAAFKSDDGRRELAGRLAMDPHRRLGHESEACCVKGIQREHADWIRSNGLTGVEVLDNGNIRFTASEREKDKYLEARGLQDLSTAGTGSKTEFEKARRGRNRNPSKRKRK